MTAKKLSMYSKTGSFEHLFFLFNLESINISQQLMTVSLVRQKTKQTKNPPTYEQHAEEKKNSL